MKTVRLLYRKQFDDQYTFDLKDNLSQHEFYAVVGLFNHTARLRPPPGPKIIWVAILLTLWVIAAVSVSMLWTHFNNPCILVTLPVFLLMSSFLTVWLYRARRTKFEENLTEICSRVNATENIRGINFRFTKNGVDVSAHKSRQSQGFRSIYAIVIELDDRYNALQSRQYN
ncbi:hypothetical protein K501DRAFT_151501, partial [Backusella circina FSU 941]